MQDKRRSAPPVKRARPAAANELRIVGGAWRSRRLRLAPGSSIRPTPNRVRETLFNWLQDRIAGARCLDLFAGSGALGIEALSRGAGEVTFVEKDARAARQIQAALEEFGANEPRVLAVDALGFLGGAASSHDVVFLDPPFASGLLAPVCAQLEAHGWLADGALIYLEAASRDGAPPLPASWQLLKAKRAGEVGYYLAERRGQIGRLNNSETP